MAKAKFNLDKMVADAQKRLHTRIEELVETARLDIKKAFADTRKRLKVK
jgi:hypothetical protein